MSINATNAPARQHERHTTLYKARFEVHPDHAAQLRLILPDSQSGFAVIDVSGGGLGLYGGIYMPKNLKVILHISGADAAPGAADADLTIRAIVRRCVMVDHKPNYQIGIQFIDAMGHDEQILVKSVKQATAGRDEVVSVGGGSGGSQG